MRTEPNRLMLTIVFSAMLLMVVGSCAERKPGKIEVSAPAVTVQAPAPIILPAPVADFDPTDLVKKALVENYPQLSDFTDFTIEWGSDRLTSIYGLGTFNLYGDRWEYLVECRKMNTGWRVWKLATQKKG